MNESQMRVALIARAEALTADESDHRAIEKSTTAAYPIGSWWAMSYFGARGIDQAHACALIGTVERTIAQSNRVFIVLNVLTADESRLNGERIVALPEELRESIDEARAEAFEIRERARSRQGMAEI